MAFVHHNQIKKLGFKLAKRLASFFARQLLIQAHIDFIRAVERFVFHLGDDFFKGAKIVLNGLIDQNIAVGEIQHAFFQPAFHQPPDDLKRRVSLARARCHHQKHAVLPAAYRFYCAVDGDALVIARGNGLVAVKMVVGQQRGLLAV